MLHMTSALNSLHNSTTGSRSMHAKGHGSVLSLPYSSRTLLTYNSTSSTQRSSGRSTTETLDRLREPDEEEEDSEPPYETIPSVPPSINVIENYVTTEAKVEPPKLSFKLGDGGRRRALPFGVSPRRNLSSVSCPASAAVTSY